MDADFTMHHEKMYLGPNLAADDLLVAKFLAALHNCVLSVIHKIEGLEILVGKSSPLEFC
jgi:hypothetical protein